MAWVLAVFGVAFAALLLYGLVADALRKRSWRILGKPPAGPLSAEGVVETDAVKETAA